MPSAEAGNFIRAIEPVRPLIALLEALDEMMRHGEHSVLAVLDGEHQTNNVVYVATTNYPNARSKDR